MTNTSEKLYDLPKMTADEVRALASGLAFVNVNEDPTRNPPSPGMTADQKIADVMKEIGISG